MRSVLPVLVLAALIAGCAAPPGNPSGPSTTAPNVRARFGAPVLAATDGGAELSLVIGADGTMLECAHGGFHVPSPMKVSADGGATWTPVPAPQNAAPSGDCDMAITSDGAWWITYDTIASASVARSTDRGRTWSLTLVAGATAGGTDRPWIQAAGTNVYLTWCAVLGVQPALCHFAKTTDGGQTWLPIGLPSRPGTDPDHGWQIMGHMITSRDGNTIRIPVQWFDSTREDAPSEYDVEQSTDGGLTWTIVKVSDKVPSPAQIPSMAQATDGTYYYVYEVSNGTKGQAGVNQNFGGPPTKDDILLRTSRDGLSWSSPILVAPQVFFPATANGWLDADPAGGVLLGYLHHTAFVPDPGPTIISVALLDVSKANPVGYNADLTDPLPSGGTVDFLMVKHDPQGRAHLAYALQPRACGTSGGGCDYIINQRPS